MVELKSNYYEADFNFPMIIEKKNNPTPSITIVPETPNLTPERTWSSQLAPSPAGVKFGVSGTIVMLGRQKHLTIP